MPETKRMETVAINNNHFNVIVISCNIEGFISIPNIKNAEALCLQKTWLDEDCSDYFEIEGSVREINSVGRGKGINTFYKPFHTCSNNVKSIK